MRGCGTVSSSRVSLYDMGFCNSQNHDTHAGYAQVPLDGEIVEGEVPIGDHVFTTPLVQQGITGNVSVQIRGCEDEGM